MTEELSRGRERDKRVLYTFVGSAVAKVITVGSTFISVPLAYRALGAEHFGLWMTITSILAAMQFADLGIGNGLLNMVAVANARDDREGARRAVASSIAILILLGIVVLTMFGSL